MLQFSKMTDYSLRILRAMYHCEDLSINSAQLARLVNIPQPMLLKVLRHLKKAGFIVSTRGRGDVNGGYTLIADPKLVTIYDLVRALHGEQCLSACLEEKRPCHGREGCCGICGLCGIREEVGRINQALVRELSKNSLVNLF